MSDMCRGVVILRSIHWSIGSPAFPGISTGGVGIVDSNRISGRIEVPTYLSTRSSLHNVIWGLGLR